MDRRFRNRFNPSPITRDNTAGRTKLGVGFENSKWRPVAVAPLTAFAIAPIAAFAAAPPLALGFAATVASGWLLLLIGRR